MLVTCRVAHLPPASDAAGTNNVLKVIGDELTDRRSTVKGEVGTHLLHGWMCLIYITKLAKRKQGEAGVDIGSFVANLTRNTTIKITKEHYGRVAFLVSVDGNASVYYCLQSSVEP